MLSVFTRLYFFLLHQDRRKVLINFLWLGLDKIGRQGINFVINVYVARYLGIELFGVWNYAIAFVLLFSFFSTLGIYNQLLRDFVKTPEQRNHLLGSAFVLKLTGGIVTLAISCLTIAFFRPDLPGLKVFVLIVSLGYVFQALDVIDYFFQSQLKAWWITIARFIPLLIFSIIKLGFIYNHQPLEFFIAAQAAELLVAGFIMVLFYYKNFGNIFLWKFEWRFAKIMLLESMPILFAEVAILIYMRLDQVMIGQMLGDAQLGIFSAAVKLSEIWYMVPGIVCSAFFPVIVRAFTLDQIDYRKKIQKVYDLLVWLSLGIAVVVSLLSRYIIYFIYGTQFMPASGILVIHIWTSVFVFVGFLSNQQLILENQRAIILYRTLFGVATNVILNFILIPRFGSQGAAWSTLMAQLFSNWLANYFFKASKPIFFGLLKSFDLKRITREYLIHPAVEKGGNIRS